jgi:hypothetical protein
VAAGDFRALPLRATFSRITCLYDSLNHAKSREDLVAAFRGMRRVMTRDSLALFDVNHPSAYSDVWAAPEPYLSRGADHRLELATMFRRRDSLARARVKGWAVYNGRRVAIDEKREQRAWSERQVVAAFRSAGLETVERIEFNPFHKEDVRPIKILFVCGLA